MLSVIKRWGLRQILTVVSAVQTRMAHDLEYELTIRARETSADYFETHLRGVPGCASSYDLIRLVLPAADPGGLFLECGVYKGSSINFIAEQLGVGNTVHGFDSFEGLPESWRRGYPKATFDLGGTLPKVRKNVVLHKGWFDRTLPEFVDANHGYVSFLHVDCDLYSSTKTIFKYFGDRVRSGSIIVFDEYFNHVNWQSGEFKAFQEFVAEKRMEYRYIGYVTNNEQVAVRIV